MMLFRWTTGQCVDFRSQMLDDFSISWWLRIENKSAHVCVVQCVTGPEIYYDSYDRCKVYTSRQKLRMNKPQSNLYLTMFQSSILKLTLNIEPCEKKPRKGYDSNWVCKKHCSTGDAADFEALSEILQDLKLLLALSQHSAQKSSNRDRFKCFHSFNCCCSWGLGKKVSWCRVWRDLMGIWWWTIKNLWGELQLSANINQKQSVFFSFRFFKTSFICYYSQYK